MKCERCKVGDACPQRCPGDGAHHGHGRVHIAGGGLLAVCPACHVEVRREWAEAACGKHLRAVMPSTSVEVPVTEYETEDGRWFAHRDGRGGWVLLDRETKATHTLERLADADTLIEAAA